MNNSLLNQEDRCMIYGFFEDIWEYPSKIDYCLKIQNSLNKEHTSLYRKFLDLIQKEFFGLKTKNDIVEVKNNLLKSSNKFNLEIAQILNNTIKINK
jgi:hypothetical protein